MPTLCILRHAKAAHPLHGQSDFDRPLTERGRADAAQIGRKLETIGIDLALVSTACRTRETWDIAGRKIEPAPVLALDPALYLCEPAALIAKLREIPNRFHSVVIIGHNPGLHEIALWLAGRSPESAGLSELRRKFPTSALAVFQLGVPKWASLAPEAATLTTFATPSISLTTNA